MNETIKTQSVLTDITPNPINDEIYSQTDLSDLILSLETHGQLEPIVVKTLQKLSSLVIEGTSL